ncbi:tryptophan ABC transporter substrate-binding protein [Lactobacillus corticis]|uniref:ABC transporter substrate-binding protein n=1 Tax=Lactobacillus corticis TaxID=2201249 RepID=A0A916VIF8_9LACO|nr:tryptophan ABC transporter substrate-binding protein [Lactobacillus corticis]GFZ27752.1 ABC transporter substrate-binding protein [Lactobacillus corticis]
MKRMYTLIALLFCYLAFAFFHEQQTTTTNKPVIGVLTLMHHQALDEIYRGFRHELAKEGYQNGKNVQLEYQNAQGDQSNLKTMAQKLVNEQANVLVGITTPAAQALASSTKKIPIVLGAVTNPKTAGLVENNQRPGANITGVSDQAPIKAELELVQKFMPRHATIGIIYTSSDSSAVSEHSEFVKLAKKLNINLKSYSIANSNDLDQVSQTMLRQVDAVIVPTDNTIASAMRTLIKNANAVKKPVFPTVDTMVKEGGVASYSINQYQLGVKAAKLAVQILRGKKKPATTPIQYSRHGTPVLNLKQAKKLGLKIPQSFLQEVKKKGELIK